MIRAGGLPGGLQAAERAARASEASLAPGRPDGHLRPSDVRGLAMRVATPLGLACAVFGPAILSIGGVARWAPADEWPRYAHDGTLSARSALGGRIARPRVAWTCSVAGREIVIELVPSAGRHRLVLGDGSGEMAAWAPSIARSGRPQADLDGTGVPRPVIETHHERWARILPWVRGWQRVAWSHTWTDQKVCRLQLFAYDGGFDRPRLVWQSDPPEDTIFLPLNVVYDIDGDGVQEVCVAAHYRVMIFEGTTGRKETELRYHKSRPYGWFGLADVDADGQMELVTIGDFQSHIDVLEYDRDRPEAERLSVKWRRDIEQNIEDRRRWPQVGPRPLADVAGDARPEIVLNLFNDTGDGQWHAVVLDAMTGWAVCDVPKRYVQGTADADGDGRADLLLAETDGTFVCDFGRIEVIRLPSGRPQVAWSAQASAWATVELAAMGPTWSTSATDGMRHVLAPEDGHGRHVFVILEKAAALPEEESPPAVIRAIRFARDMTAEQLWRAEGLIGDPVVLGAGTASGPPASRPSAVASSARTGSSSAVGALVRLQLPAEPQGAVVASGARVRVVEDRRLGVVPSAPIAARLRPTGPVVVVVEGPGRRTYALEPPSEAGAAARIAWCRPGRGMGDGSRWLGPMAADLDGDGGCEVVVAGQASSGAASLVAYRHDGTPLWRRVFAQTSGAVPVWNRSALTFWWPGRFRSAAQTDVFVNHRRGPMHSDVGELLDGRTGRTVWRQEKAVMPGEFTWGYAGMPPGVADVNGDGLDELVCLYPVCFWVGEGATGRLAVGREFASRRRLPAWAAYGEPMIYDFTGDGRPDILLDSPYIVALLDAGGEPLWHGPGRASYPTRPGEGNAGEVTQTRHALVDIDGDGVFEIASAGYGDGLRLIDPRDGRVLWSLAAPAPTCPRVVAADIDGRPGDEVLYPAGSRLVAVSGDRRAGRILWEWSAGAPLSMPAVADTDGDGDAEVVVVDGSARVYALDSDQP